jgi:hypothetical protein
LFIGIHPAPLKSCTSPSAPVGKWIATTPAAVAIDLKHNDRRADNCSEWGGPVHSDEARELAQGFAMNGFSQARPIECVDRARPRPVPR